ncbi:Rv1733c family protein [Streptomyces sp. SP18CS02]|uniref:Rv1733c family protein n=1 Tax=Streptomyces sp. SP18CS02 TaxID=3002531 RepID=UPI002E791472|nr:hypothetical protein [Streptomyces sp. SP18CS02]MEE1755316.1 hypothetical protein [Streptomyces sp. SP18CS02]
MRAAIGLWRWRHNPLRRGTDLAEAWLALLALVLLCFAAPAVGWVSGSLTDASLQKSVRLQNEQRHPTTAHVLGPESGARAPSRDPEASGEHRMRASVPARWTGPDGARHTGMVTTARQSPDPGDSFRIWTDARGRPVNPPLNTDTAREHAVVAGIGAMLVTAGLVEGGRRLVVWRLMQRRYTRLDQAWAKAGPDWGRTDAGG